MLTTNKDTRQLRILCKSRCGQIYNRRKEEQREHERDGERFYFYKEKNINELKGQALQDNKEKLDSV